MTTDPSDFERGSARLVWWIVGRPRSRDVFVRRAAALTAGASFVLAALLIWADFVYRPGVLVLPLWIASLVFGYWMTRKYLELRREGH